LNLQRTNLDRSVYALAIVFVCLLGVVGCGSGGGSSSPPPPPPPPAPTATLVSGPSPFAAGCDGGNSTQKNYENAEVEAWLAQDPTNAAHLIVVYQEDRWHGGGAHGLVTATTRDGGKTWARSMDTYDRCEGGNAGNNGNYERTSDPWVTISPDGTVFQSGLSFDVVSDANQSVQVSRSTDGGNTWSEPTTLIFDTEPNVGLDKDSSTADPNHPGYAYVIWSRYLFTDPSQSILLDSPAMFSRTTDGGNTWEAARIIYDPPSGFYALEHQIVALPNGTLVDMFLQNDASSAAYYTIRSSDQGLTWSSPTLIDVSQDIGVADVKTGEPVREGVANMAVNPTTGQLYFVWMDARFSGGLRNGIAFSTSTDAGLTWTPAVQINQAPNVQAFAPGIAVTSGGRIAVTYYDFRNDNSDPNVLLTNYWRITSTDGGHTWKEIPLSASFDLRTAPMTLLGYMVTDYEGIAAVGESFMELFVAVNSGNTSNPTDVFATSTETGIGGNARANEHDEINLHPRSLMEQWHPFTLPIGSSGSTPRRQDD
jgi:BNR repeat-like domain